MLRKGQATFSKTRSILQRLVVYTASRGFLVTGAQSGHIIMYLSDPTDVLFWLSTHLTLSKIYVVSTLVTLNNREALQNGDGLMIDTLRFYSTYPNPSGDIESASLSVLDVFLAEG
ncbi:hypothetical protein DXG01_016681 [Tephrocybe rancida]|nr:hypothetical protein DXG01_016681 [Tephrocybe rancida]